MEQDVLDPGEELLWQGRPDVWPFVTTAQLATLVQGGIALGLFLYLIARLQMGIPPLWDVRVIVLVVVFKTVPIEIVASVLKRRRQTYLLTEARAIIVTQGRLFGRRVQSFPLRPALPLDFLQGRRLSSLWFAPARPGLLSALRGKTAPGFERITDGARVFALVRKLQEGQP